MKNVYEVKNEMKKIYKSIDKLCDILYDKGYDGIYVLNEGQTGKLPDLLRAHLLCAISDPMAELLPVKIRTVIALPTQNNRRYLAAEFNVDYDSKRGVHITDCRYHIMDSVTRQPIQSKHLPIHLHSNLPTAKKATRYMKNKKANKV